MIHRLLRHAPEAALYQVKLLQQNTDFYFGPLTFHLLLSSLVEIIIYI